MPQDLSVSSLFNVKGKTALVTGGSSGIGKMIALGLAQNGAQVYIAARKEGQLKEAVADLRKNAKEKVDYIVADLKSKSGVDNLIAEFRKRESKLHILVNNSGITWGAPWDNFPEAKGWDNLMAVNVKSIFYLTFGLSDLLEKDATAMDPGRVINTSSTASVTAGPEGRAMSEPGHGTWSYATSKAAVNHLTSQLAVDLGPRHITVNAILPGFFPSKMTAFGLKQLGEDVLARRQPSGRLGMPQDVAGIVLFLASPASAHVTGAHIILDGGATLSGGGITPQTKL